VLRKRSKRDTDLERAFGRVLALVEGAKHELVAAVPSARAPGRSLADSLLGFEMRLRDADREMDSWKDGEIATLWEKCRTGLVESSRRAERLRLEAPAMEFEVLIATIADLMVPLEVFEEAVGAVRDAAQLR
jgi:hypothetical protein